MQGDGEEIPRYLRYNQKVRNRRLGKRDCSLLIKDIWREKTNHDAEVFIYYFSVPIDKFSITCMRVTFM